MNNDNHVPHADGVWKFDESVTENFDAMLKASIPDYASMRRLTASVAKNILNNTRGRRIVDLGASRGDALANFIEDHNCIALEVSEPMLAVLYDRFKDSASVLNFDLRCTEAGAFPFEQMSNTLIQSILTLQFVPIEYRQNIVSAVYESLIPGGAFILVEKVLGSTSVIDNILVTEYYNIKKSNGYSEDSILQKKKSLEGVLVPVTASWNEQLLKQAGFSHIDCFYRSLNFCGFIAVK